MWTYYWCLATHQLGYWFVENVHEGAYAAVIQEMNDFKRNQPPDIANGPPRILLMGREKSGKKHWFDAYHWLLVSDPFNDPGYIIKTSKSFFVMLKNAF